MFLTLGLTADVAAAHRNDRSSLTRQESTVQKRLSSPWHSPFSSPVAGPSSPQLMNLRPSLLQSESRSTVSGMDAVSPEIDQDAYSDSAYSLSNSLTSSGRIRARESRTRRQKQQTSYRLAHPPPTVIRRPRLHLRPKLILQLQRVSTSVRPTPTLDVLPSSVYGAKFARKWPRFSPSKIGLGSSGLVVVKSERYQRRGNVEDETRHRADIEGDDGKEVVGTICPLWKEDSESVSKAEIRLGVGLIWQATALPTGGYDFVAMDEHGLKHTVRWVRRRSTRTSPLSPEMPRRFGFSVIDPRSRKHPIIASMTQTTLDIYNTSTLDGAPPEQDTLQSSGRRSSFTSTTPSSAVDGPESSQPSSPFQSVELLRTLILVTGIWISFCEGWSSDARHRHGRSSTTLTNVGALHSNHGRSISTPYQGPLRPRSSSFDNADPLGELPTALSRPGGPATKEGSNASSMSYKTSANSLRRASSTGATFMRKAKNADLVLHKRFDVATPAQAKEDTIESTLSSSSPEQSPSTAVPISQSTVPLPSEARGTSRNRPDSTTTSSTCIPSPDVPPQLRSDSRPGRPPKSQTPGPEPKKWKKMKGLMGLFQKL